jgi:hypothetical protein
MTNAPVKLLLARDHLENVLEAWSKPTDWKDLSVYAASMHVGLPTSRSHWKRVETAGELHDNWNLPDVSDLLRDLNDARKSHLYGDIPDPGLDAEDVASRIEEYVNAVEQLFTGTP